MRRLENHWYRSSLSGLTMLLWPLSWLFHFMVALRRFFYRSHIKKTIHFTAPVIVVGNITVGGTGKTPFVIWLADLLEKKGYRVGIVSRGVGGKKLRRPYWVNGNTDPAIVGDEALLLVRRTHCPMVVCVDRVLAVKELLQKTNCNMVISDDGLQHYRMGRVIEIAVIDGERCFGNEKMLPAGPLREPLARLNYVDLIIMNGAPNKKIFFKRDVAFMQFQGDTLFSLKNPGDTKSLAYFQQKEVHAIAGIGNPERFFSLLREHQIQVIPHVFPDHYLYQRDDLDFEDGLPVLMTEKDAVKCIEFSNQQDWYLPVTAQVEDHVKEIIINLLRKHQVSTHSKS